MKITRKKKMSNTDTITINEKVYDISKLNAVQKGIVHNLKAIETQMAILQSSKIVHVNLFKNSVKESDDDTDKDNA
jgi:hypothetical protein|tara:strand:+ start:145 stop:372 length:228 start_codon:yes stop_codon:yes gene_type:complete